MRLSNKQPDYIWVGLSLHGSSASRYGFGAGIRNRSEEAQQANKTRCIAN